MSPLRNSTLWIPASAALGAPGRAFRRSCPGRRPCRSHQPAEPRGSRRSRRRTRDQEPSHPRPAPRPPTDCRTRGWQPPPPAATRPARRRRTSRGRTRLAADRNRGTRHYHVDQLGGSGVTLPHLHAYRSALRRSPIRCLGHRHLLTGHRKCVDMTVERSFDRRQRPRSCYTVNRWSPPASQPQPPERIRGTRSSSPRHVEDTPALRRCHGLHASSTRCLPTSRS